MFFHLLYIHLFRPFLKYNPSNSPLPSHVSPRKLCSQAAGSVSKLMRLYKRTYGLRQICNIAVYIVHSACTIHLLNLPEKTAKRDIIHGVKHLEEIAEDWLCARRTLSILSVLARKWSIELPEEAATVFARTDAKFGYFSTADVPSPKQELVVATPPSNASTSPQPTQPVADPVSMQTQTQLQQSLYSYIPNLDTAPRVAQARQPDFISEQTTRPPLSNSNVGAMTLPSEDSVASMPYLRYNNPQPSLQAAMSAISSRSQSGIMSESSGRMTRQVSPNTMFGGVEALVESQDWWLRDQASLFGNWMNVGPVAQNGVASSNARNVVTTDPATDLDNMAGIASGFYIGSPNPTNGKRNGDAFDDDWSYS